MGVFHAYDIRGVYGEEINEEFAYVLGRAVAHYMNVSTIMVGHDMRTSSEPLREQLIKGITDQGVNVVTIGLCSTPFFYWATQQFPAGIMVTASHNPAKYNGFKICRDGAKPFGIANGLKDVEQLVHSNQFQSAETPGNCTSKSLLKEFLEFGLSFLKTDKKFKVVIDAANGMGGYTYGELMKNIPNSLELIPMFFELDGTFPNHEANPLKDETLVQLKEKVLQEKADLGVALDGDGDRVVFVDNEGNTVASDITTALLSRQILQEQPGAIILYDIRQSRVTPEVISAAGGTPVMTRVGHTFIKLKMIETNAAFGGELSGHFYNKEQQNTENTMIVFFRMLNLLASEEQTLSELANPLREKYSKIEETNYTVQDKEGIIARLKQEYTADDAELSEIDGIRIDFPEWWFNVRASNTEPLLRLNLEAKTRELRDAKKKEIEEKITRSA